MTAIDEYHASLQALNRAEELPKGRAWRWVAVTKARVRHALAVRALAKAKEVAR